jgi:hypothetical protein
MALTEAALIEVKKYLKRFYAAQIIRKIIGRQFTGFLEKELRAAGRPVVLMARRKQNRVLRPKCVQASKKPRG